MTWYEGLDALPGIRFDAARIESQSAGATGIEAPLSTGAREQQPTGSASVGSGACQGSTWAGFDHESWRYSRGTNDESAP